MKMNLLINSIISIVIVLVLDSIWFTFKFSLYNSIIKSIQSDNLKIKIYSAAVAYLLMFLSFYLIIYPNIQNDKNTNNLIIALKHGAIFGFILYGIYNFTNYAIFKNYSLKLTITDTLWGTFVYFIAVLITIIISKRM